MDVSPLLPAFGLTLAMSFLVGLALREYYLAQEHLEYFGSVRTTPSSAYSASGCTSSNTAAPMQSDWPASLLS